MQRKDSSITFKLFCSYFEIYNEKVQDLLDPSTENLRVGEDKQRGFFVENLIQKEVKNTQEIFDAIRIGIENRHISATSMN